MPKCIWIAVRAEFRRYLVPERVGVTKQRLLYFRRYFIKVQRLAEDLPATSEMPAHNRMIRVHFAQRPTSVFNIGAEKVCSMLIFKLLHAATVGVAKEKTDHTILEDAINEGIDDRAQSALAAEFFKKALAHAVK